MQWLALIALIIGARLWLISVFGSALPFLDQWDGEAGALFKPWLEGTLRWTDFFHPHNEHRIVFSRLLALGLLQLNGQWDGLLEITANALLCGVIGLGVAAGLLRIVGREYRFLVFAVVILWLALPYAHENTLWGFQSAFYFLLLFSLLAIWGLGFFPACSRNWWLGVIGAILACLSMGSGVLAAAVVLILETVRLIAKRRRLSEAAPTCLFAILIVALGLYFRITYLPHEALKAASIGAWLNVFARSLAWPHCTMPMLILVMYLPWALCSVLMVTTNKEELRPRAEILFAVGAWVIAQAAAIGYARGEDGNIPISSRYMDILGLGAAINALCIVVLIKSRVWRGKWKAGAFALGSIWLAAVVWGATQLSLQKVMSESRKEALRPLEENVRAYVATRDFEHLLAGSPYPDAGRMAAYLDDPTIRKILPAIVRPALPIEIRQETGHAFVAKGYPTELDTPPYERSWGSYSQSGREARGSFESQSFHSASPYLQFEVAGNVRGEMSLSLRDEETGREMRINSKARLNENWRSAIVSVPGGKVHIVANDDSAKKWFAFREPRELGRFSYYAQRAVSNGKYLLIFGLAIVTLLMVNALVGLSRLSPWPKSDKRHQPESCQ
jgi:hypothetical protein